MLTAVDQHDCRSTAVIMCCRQPWRGFQCLCALVYVASVSVVPPSTHFQEFSIAAFQCATPMADSPSRDG